MNAINWAAPAIFAKQGLNKVEQLLNDKKYYEALELLHRIAEAEDTLRAMVVECCQKCGDRSKNQHDHAQKGHA